MPANNQESRFTRWGKRIFQGVLIVLQPVAGLFLGSMFARAQRDDPADLLRGDTGFGPAALDDLTTRGDRLEQSTPYVMALATLAPLAIAGIEKAVNASCSITKNSAQRLTTVVLRNGTVLLAGAFVMVSSHEDLNYSEPYQSAPRENYLIPFVIGAVGALLLPDLKAIISAVRRCFSGSASSAETIPLLGPPETVHGGVQAVLNLDARSDGRPIAVRAASAMSSFVRHNPLLIVAVIGTGTAGLVYFNKVDDAMMQEDVNSIAEVVTGNPHWVIKFLANPQLAQKYMHSLVLGYQRLTKSATEFAVGIDLLRWGVTNLGFYVIDYLAGTSSCCCLSRLGARGAEADLEHGHGGGYVSLADMATSGEASALPASESGCSSWSRLAAMLPCSPCCGGGEPSSESSDLLTHDPFADGSEAASASDQSHTEISEAAQADADGHEEVDVPATVVGQNKQNLYATLKRVKAVASGNNELGEHVDAACAQLEGAELDQGALQANLNGVNEKALQAAGGDMATLRGADFANLFAALNNLSNAVVAIKDEVGLTVDDDWRFADVPGSGSSFTSSV